MHTHEYTLPRSTPLVALDWNVWFLQDDVPRRTYELEQYLQDAINLFLYRFSRLSHYSDLSPEDEKRLPLLLKEIIEVKKLIVGRED